MVTPIKSRSYLIAYFIVWSVLGVAQFLILYLLYKVNPLAAAFDSLVSNALFSIFGLSIWFVAKYNKVDAIKITPTIGSHLAAMALILGLWLLLSRLVLLNLFVSNEYAVFWEESLVGRAVAGALYYLIVALNFYVFVL